MTPRFPALPDDLPPGRLVLADESDWAPPELHGTALLWVSDAPAQDAGEVWARLRGAHAQTGLVPLLLEHDDDHPDAWVGRWSFPEPAEVLDAVDPETALRSLWDDLQDDAGSDADEVPGAGEPSGPWPGLARPGQAGEDPEALADAFARHLQDDVDPYGRPRPWRLGLVPARDGAGALTLAGWDGPCNHTNDTELVSAVLRSWADRFGARVVGVGTDTLLVSVARPPQDLEHARALAIEHFAVCPDNVWQGAHDTFDGYAHALVGTHAWSFWWD
ncbi:MAG: DUF4253 domain-containing protein [Cellulosimicrobium cellulans]